MYFRWLDHPHVQATARLILRFELFIIIAIVYANWHITSYRQQWAWLFLLLIPVGMARFAIQRRLWTRTPLDIWLAFFVVLCIVNIQYAPYTRGSVMLLRLAASFLVYWTWVEYARARQSVLGLWVGTLFLGMVIGLVALATTQWVSKSADLNGIIRLLPSVDASDFLPDAMLSFNPNEIGGALAWLCPLLFGFIFYPRLRQNYDTSIQASIGHPPNRHHHTNLLAESAVRALQGGAIAAFLVVALALFLGQSRFAIIGVLFALLIIVWFGLPRRRLRYVLSLGIVLVAVFELALVFNFFPFSGATDTAQTETALSQRDEDSLTKRGDIWASGLLMVRDYPFTGIGMSMFRTASSREAAYAIPSFAGRIVPHAHNELLQVATDLGIPGLSIFLIWHGVLGFMLWRVWQTGNPAYQLLAVSVAGAFVAHAIFGIGDAITLWDRFIFVFWWLAGLTGALYSVVKHNHHKNEKNMPKLNTL